MLSHCITAVSEAVVRMPLLLIAPVGVPSSTSFLASLSASLSFGVPPTSSGRPFMRHDRRGRRRHASTDAADVIFRDRCHAFLTGRWSCLLAVPDAARRLLHDSGVMYADPRKCTFESAGPLALS